MVRRSKFSEQPQFMSLTPSAASSVTTYLLKITLVDSAPEVWRQVIVPAQITLAALHSIVQGAMGWENQHSYLFRLGIGQPPCDPQLRLSEALIAAPEAAPEAAVYYSYDLRCGWLHRLTVETLPVEALNVTPAGQQSMCPICIDGAAACPPEGSGGVWGYDEWLAKLEDPDDPDYLDLIDQYGDFDPDKFDLAAANVRLSSLISEASS